MAQRSIDFEALGKPDFNLKGWINDALSSAPVNEPLEVRFIFQPTKPQKHAQSLNIKLQQMMFELGGIIDEKSSSCVLKIPGWC